MNSVYLWFDCGKEMSAMSAMSVMSMMAERAKWAEWAEWAEWRNWGTWERSMASREAFPVWNTFKLIYHLWWNAITLFARQSPSISCQKPQKSVILLGKVVRATSIIRLFWNGKFAVLVRGPFTLGNKSGSKSFKIPWIFY